jgi:5-hydroxytryptamine receptor 7
MLAVIFFVWLGSACVSLPPLLLLGNEHFDPDNSTIPICTVSQNFWYQIYATMASFYVPLFVMVVVYVKILRVVADKKKEMCWKHRPSALMQQLPSHNNSMTTENSVLVNVSVNVKSGKSLSHKSQLRTGSRQYNGGPQPPPVPPPASGGSGPGYTFPTSTLHRLKKEKVLSGLREHKASTTLGIIMSAFIICWLPFFVLALVRPFCTKIFHVEIPGWVSSLFLWLGYANSALNPVIYATLNRDFRRPFKEILCFRCSTLDTLMRREFYNHQFGDDPENLRHKQPLAASRDEVDVPTNL